MKDEKMSKSLFVGDYIISEFNNRLEKFGFRNYPDIYKKLYINAIKRLPKVYEPKMEEKK